MAEFSSSPAATADDATWDGNLTFDNSGTVLKVNATDFDTIPENSFAVRVPNVTIPPGATISAAKLTLTPAATIDTTSHNIIIQCYDEDDSAQLTDGFDGYSRPLTTANSSGNFGSLTAGSVFDTFDFASAIQEVIDRAGWSSGNAIQVWVTCNSGVPTIEVGSREHGTYADPLLVITYTAGGGGGQPYIARVSGVPGARLGGASFGRGW